MTTQPSAVSKPERKSNHLIHEKSPYLQQHAYNPVDWYPWGPDALEKARLENKPIFLSIGYSTCHWCHVMERESFENDGIAGVMNRSFVCIKVDREERPDLDKIYMTAVQATTGSGGWPMSVWLTPDLKPFYCGTYFPPESRWGRPGFKELLERVHDVWESNHDGIVHQAGEIMETLRQHLAVGRDGSPNRPPDEAALRLAAEQFHATYDAEHGGFGGAPKFPRPVVLNLLFRCSARLAGSGTDADRRDAEQAQAMALHTLRAMAEGGLFDQLGGGFHRYSVDDHWLAPHFEKMLYDQAQLAASYVEAYQLTREPFYAGIARRTLDYVLRDLASPDGGFYSAEDADSEGVEGKFYVWTREEIEQVVGGPRAVVAAEHDNQSGRPGGRPSMTTEEIDVFCRYYGVTADGNWEHGQSILHVTLTPDQAGKLFHKPPAEIAAVLEEGRAKLLAARGNRIRPHRDDKILTSWNGLMISCLARAGQVLPAEAGRDRFREAAIRAAHHILAQQYRDQHLWRTPTVPAVVDDYAAFATGLVDLYETTFDPQWLLKAIELTDAMIRLFGDPKDGGFFMTSGEDPSVIVRVKEEYDGAEPSGNSVAALLLLRLAQYTDRADYREAAEKTLAAFGAHLRQAPQAVPQMLCALDFALSQPKQIVVAGDPNAGDTRAMIQAVQARFLPNKVMMLADGGPAQRTLAKLLPFLENIQPVQGRATAYVCENHTCKLPTIDLAVLRKLLADEKL